MNLDIYLISWASLCTIAAMLIILNPAKFSIFSKKYFKFISKGWKITTFLIATVFLTLISLYMGDPTWDYFDMPMMAILSFITAPWSVSVFYRIFKKKSSSIEIFLAIIFWMISASWSYDLYILIRDGVYPATWLVNIPASSALYFFAGLFWSIEYSEKKGLIFSFQKEDSFSENKTPFIKIIPFLLFLSALIMSLLIYGSFY